MNNLPLALLVLQLAAVTAPEAHAESDDDDDRSTFTVPSGLRNRGYSLRLAGRKKLVALDDKEVSFDLQRRASVDLVDTHGRTVDRAEISPGGDIDMRARSYSLGVSTGYSTVADYAPLRQAFLPRTMRETTFEAAWRPGPWGAFFQWTQRSASRTLEEELKLDYAASIYLVGVAREVAVQRMHLALLIAGGVNDTTYELKDDYAGIAKESRTAAAAAGIEARIPVYGNLWVSVKVLGRVESFALDQLDASGLVYLNTNTLGVSYAF